MKGFHLMALPDPTHGEVLLAVAVPRDGEPWGVLAPLRGTPWGDAVREVTGEALSHARHGWSTPLMREVGPHPHDLARRIPPEAGACDLSTGGRCAGASPLCRPGKKMPDCYEPPGLAETEQQVLAATVALFWREGRYVLTVRGSEFSLG